MNIFHFTTNKRIYYAVLPSIITHTQNARQDFPSFRSAPTVKDLPLWAERNRTIAFLTAFRFAPLHHEVNNPPVKTRFARLKESGTCPLWTLLDSKKATIYCHPPQRDWWHCPLRSQCPQTLFVPRCTLLRKAAAFLRFRFGGFATSAPLLAAIAARGAVDNINGSVSDVIRIFL